MAQSSCPHCGGYRISSRSGAAAQLFVILGFFTFGLTWIMLLIGWLIGSIAQALGAKSHDLYTCDICGYQWEG